MLVLVCAQRKTALRCDKNPYSVSLNLLLKFNNITIVQHLFHSYHIAKPMLAVLNHSTSLLL